MFWHQSRCKEGNLDVWLGMVGVDRVAENLAKWDGAHATREG